MRRTLVVIAILLLVAIGWYVACKHPKDYGTSRLYANQTYHFEALRVLNDTSVVGGDLNEVLQTIAKVESGDAEGWYNAWTSEGDRVAALAQRTSDPISKGRALLRAHNYYRSSEFFLAPNDPRREVAWKKNTDNFYAGLDALHVLYDRISVPYGKYHLNALYFPGPAGASDKPLIVAITGYDGTMEEMYFSIVAAAHDRGYSVLVYEGPGQGSILRKQGLTMTPEWEKPNAVVLDTFLASHPKPMKIVMVGESLGGYLAPRAAAFDSRIDGVVAQDVFYDAGEAVSQGTPRFAKWLIAHGHTGILDALSKLSDDPGRKWTRDNGMWVFGLSSPYDIGKTFSQYTLAPVASRITSDVLILAGTNDHFIPLEQVDQFKQSLTHARSVKAVVFDKASGGNEHCQIGAPSLWQASFFDWITDTYGQSRKSL